MPRTGVYPVFENKFKINKSGREGQEADMVLIKEMESFSVSMDGNVEEWTPMDTEGWIRRLMTGKGFAISLAGKRHIGDPATIMLRAARGKRARTATANLNGSSRAAQSSPLTA